MWHTRLERKIIKKYGGEPLIKYGYDGLINNKPVEVRAVKKDDRFRIQKNVHKELIRKKGGYIFINENGESRRRSAKDVSRKLGGGKWYKDRKYPHKFLDVDEVF